MDPGSRDADRDTDAEATDILEGKKREEDDDDENDDDDDDDADEGPESEREREENQVSPPDAVYDDEQNAGETVEQQPKNAKEPTDRRDSSVSHEEL